MIPYRPVRKEANEEYLRQTTKLSKAALQFSIFRCVHHTPKKESPVLKTRNLLNSGEDNTFLLTITMEGNKAGQDTPHTSALGLQQPLTVSLLPLFLEEYAQAKARIEALMKIAETVDLEDPKYKRALNLAHFWRKQLVDVRKQVRLAARAPAFSSNTAISAVHSVPSVPSTHSLGSHHLTVPAQPPAKRCRMLDECFQSLSDALLKNDDSQIPEENKLAVQRLFEEGLRLTELSKVANPPQHHHIETNGPIPDVIRCPDAETENEIVYSVCYLISALVGKGFTIHDIYSPMNVKARSPDITIIPVEQEGPPRIAETANFALKISTEEHFGTDDHIKQVLRYASSIHTNFGFNQCFVVLACQTKVQFLMMEFSEQAPMLYRSECMHLSVNQGVLSEGLTSLRAFVLNARNKMIAAEQAELVSSTDSSIRISLEWNNCETLAVKSTSMTCKVVDGSSSFVLKHVAGQREFENELRAIKSIAPHANIASCIAHDTLRKYLLIAPLGDCTLDIYPIAKRALEFEQMMGPLLEGLDHVHKQGWLHRDIRPENIVFCEQANKLVLIDFGLAAPGSMFESKVFVGFRKFSPEDHLHQLANVDKARWRFKWNIETDRKALFRVAKFIFNNMARGYLNLSYDKYSACEEEGEKINRLREFLALRQRLFAESDLISLEAALRF